MGWEIAFAFGALAAAAPLFAVTFPPIQDLPQHLAAMRILIDYDAASLHFSEFFEVDLFRTQYLGYYTAVRALALFLPLELANRVALGLALVATPYALRALLRALGRDERHALLALPLTWNAHLILGFLNFVAAFPLMLFGLALAVEQRKDTTLRAQFTSPARRRAFLLGFVTVATFATHVVPFAFLGLGAALIGMGEGARPTLRRWLALVPGGLVSILWALRSPAGQATVAATSNRRRGRSPSPLRSPRGCAARGPELAYGCLSRRSRSHRAESRGARSS